MKQKEHLKLIRPVHEINELIRHLKHEEGFYGVFIKDLDNYIYIGYAVNMRQVCGDLLSKSKRPSNMALPDYMNRFEFYFDKLPVSVPQIEIERLNKHLNLIYHYKTYPPAFNGHGLNFTNPVTGKRFKKAVDRMRKGRG